MKRRTIIAFFPLTFLIVVFFNIGADTWVQGVGATLLGCWLAFVFAVVIDRTGKDKEGSQK